MRILEENGLELKGIGSISIPIEENIVDAKSYIKEKFNEDGLVVAYLDYKVLMGRYKDSRFVFADNEDFLSKHVQKIRVFNNEKEIYIWRSSRGFKGRFRIDTEGKGTFIVDACQVLFGTDAKDFINGFTKVTEKRGTELILPFSNLNKVDNQQNRVCLKTRNYINFNKITHQASYCDVRFLGFLFKDQKLGKKEKNR